MSGGAVHVRNAVLISGEDAAWISFVLHDELPRLLRDRPLPPHVPARLLEVFATLRRAGAAHAATISANGRTEDVPADVWSTVCTDQPTVTVEEAAAMLNVSPRRVRQLAPELEGCKVAGRWLVSRAAVETHRDRKEART